MTDKEQALVERLRFMQEEGLFRSIGHELYCEPGEAADLIQSQAARITELEWQPIETAPKDGTRILAWANRLGWEADGFSCVTVERHGNRWVVMGARNCKSFPDTKDECSPTHWMPLPTPPAEGQTATQPNKESE